MIFAAETLTDPAAIAAASRYSDIILTAIVSVVITSGVGGFFVWLYNRRKTNSEVNVNESEVIQNLVNVVASLGKDIEGFITQTRTLRAQVEAVQAEKRTADAAIDEAKTAAVAAVSAMRATHAEYMLKAAERIPDTLGRLETIQAGLDDCPDNNEMKRAVVFVVEYLYYLRRQLTGK